MNPKASTIRLRVDFTNVKYLLQGNQVELWNESRPADRCLANIKGKSSRYVLLQLPEYDECLARVHVSVGSYLHLESEDMKKNIETGRELVDILLKKRLAMQAKTSRHRRELESQKAQIKALNDRYDVLLQKLELERKNEIAAVERDRAQTYSSYKDAQASLNDIDHKLERYRIEEQNFAQDRWSLDPAQYIKIAPRPKSLGLEVFNQNEGEL